MSTRIEVDLSDVLRQYELAVRYHNKELLLHSLQKNSYEGKIAYLNNLVNDGIEVRAYYSLTNGYEIEEGEKKKK